MTGWIRRDAWNAQCWCLCCNGLNVRDGVWLNLLWHAPVEVEDLPNSLTHSSCRYFLYSDVTFREVGR